MVWKIIFRAFEQFKRQGKYEELFSTSLNEDSLKCTTTRMLPQAAILCVRLAYKELIKTDLLRFNCQ